MLKLFKKRSKEKEMPFYDYSDAIKYIEESTLIDRNTIINILEAEEKYMTSVGIMDGTYIRKDLEEG